MPGLMRAGPGGWFNALRKAGLAMVRPRTFDLL